jgi:hypothetical protein
VKFFRLKGVKPLRTIFHIYGCTGGLAKRPYDNTFERLERPGIFWRDI